MPVETVEIPKQVLDSVDTLDELLDWLMAQNPLIIGIARSAADRLGRPLYALGAASSAMPAEST